MQSYAKKTFVSTGNAIFDQALQSFDDHMVIANSALATRKGYVRGLQKLILHYNKLPEDCTVHQIKSFLSYLKETDNYSASTLNLRVCHSS